MPAPDGLQVRDVTVRFGRLTAVDGAGLTAPPGTVTGLIGPDGAGKTTLCDVIAGLRRQAGGHRPPGRRRPDRQRGAGAGPARHRPHVPRVGRFPDSPGDGAGRRRAARADRRAAGPDGARPVAPPFRRPARRGPARRRGHRPRRHRGVRGRCAGTAPPGVALLTGLARALTADPAVLLLDEPWAGLPERYARALEVLLRDLAAEGLAVLVVERDLEPLLGVCDVLHVLDGGRVIRGGGRPRSARTRESGTPTSASPRVDPRPGPVLDRRAWRTPW